MRNIYLAAALLLLSLSAEAQKKFFQKLEAATYFFIDDIYFQKNDWAKAFKSPVSPLSPKFDSLSSYMRGRGLSIRGGTGGSLRLHKELAVFGKQASKHLFWTTGFGYHNFKMKSAFYSSHPSSMTDTAKVYLEEYEQFQLRQHYLDVYNSLRYEVDLKFWKKAFVFVGLGVQVSAPLSSKVNEVYHTDTYQWATSSRRWIKSGSSETERLIAAKMPLMFCFSLPIGSGLRFSDHISMAGTIEYFYALCPLRLTQKEKHSDGALFNLSFIYRFN